MEAEGVEGTETDKATCKTDKETYMKIIIPIDGDNLNSNINRTFGRTKQFIMIDSNNNSFKLIDNIQNLQATQGAGIQSAQLVVKAGADAVITMHLGPKAHSVLSNAGVKVMMGQLDTIENNINAYKKDALKEMTDANVESHWV